MKQIIRFLCCSASVVTAFVPTLFGMRKQSLQRRHVVGKDYFDMDELRHRIMDESNPYSDLRELFRTTEWENRPKPSQVNIIFFQPDTADEGVHTIEYPKGSGSNVILAFESMADCGTFASMLKKQNFYDPTPQQVDLRSLEAYCEQIGVFVQVVPRGMHVLPPKQNVVELGHNPSLKDEKNQLDYIFAMSDSDLDEVGVIEVEDFVNAWE